MNFYYLHILIFIHLTQETLAGSVNALDSSSPFRTGKSIFIKDLFMWFFPICFLS